MDVCYEKVTGADLSVLGGIMGNSLQFSSGLSLATASLHPSELTVYILISPFTPIWLC